MASRFRQGRANIAILNGTVRNWSGDGVDAFGAGHSRLERLRVVGNQGTGMRLGRQRHRGDCTAQGNTLDGIEAECRLRACGIAPPPAISEPPQSARALERPEQLRRLQQRN
jgi:hypothetical protein